MSAVWRHASGALRVGGRGGAGGRDRAGQHVVAMGEEGWFALLVLRRRVVALAFGVRACGVFWPGMEAGGALAASMESAAAGKSA